MDLEQLPAVSAPLPWQAEPWSRLKQQIEAGQLPHALMLAGSQHIGKGRLALALARLLLCHQPNGGLNCGHCHACELSARGNHGDFRWLQPGQKSRVIKIDQVREVVEFGNKTAGFGERKVIVLMPADSMNTNAANALLKSLEEPAADTYLILVCHRLQGVPATIRSRCQMLKLGPPARESSLGWLDHMTGEREQSEQLLALADDRPLLAEQLYRDDGAEGLVAVRLAMRGLLAGKVPVPAVLALLGETPVDEVLTQLTVEVQGMLSAMDRAALDSARSRAAFYLLDEISNLQRAVNAGANPNRQLLLEAILGKLHRELGAAGGGGSISSSRGTLT